MMLNIRRFLCIVAVILIFLFESFKRLVMTTYFNSVVIGHSMLMETLLAEPGRNCWLMVMESICSRLRDLLLLLNNLLLQMLVTLVTYLLILLLCHPCQRMMAWAARKIYLLLLTRVPLWPNEWLRMWLMLILLTLLLLLGRVTHLCHILLGITKDTAAHSLLKLLRIC